MCSDGSMLRAYMSRTSVTILSSTPHFRSSRFITELNWHLIIGSPCAIRFIAAAQRCLLVRRRCEPFSVPADRCGRCAFLAEKSHRVRKKNVIIPEAALGAGEMLDIYPLEAEAHTASAQLRMFIPPLSSSFVIGCRLLRAAVRSPFSKQFPFFCEKKMVSFLINPGHYA